MFDVSFVQTVITPIALKLFYALVLLIVGLKVIKVLEKRLAKSMEKAELDPSLESFSLSIMRMVLKVVLFLIIAATLGVQMTSIIAMLGAASFAIGLAFQGSLANFAGGVLILIFKPFKIGDFIEGDGQMGTVREITIIYTYLTTVDNKNIVIPNGSLSNHTIVNYSKFDTRRVDLVFGVGYDSNIDHTKKTIGQVIENHPMVMKDPEPFIRLGNHNDSSLDFTVRVWCKSEDYWTVYFDMLEMVKEAFDREKIEIPYPHVDVNMIGSEK